MSTLSGPPQQLQILAPAKINLSLKIHGRRQDRFHEIETLMVPLALSDELEIHLQAASENGPASITLSCDDETLPTDSTNLAYRAAALFLESAGGAFQVDLKLKKNIPHGAGLAGGSSDAAAVLLGLNRMVPLAGGPLPIEDLAKLGAKIGSDIPFFLYQSAAVCRGRGEIVEPCVFPESLSLVLFKPPFGIPTPWVYSKWEESRDVPGAHYKPQEFSWGQLVNDLERPVFQKYFFLAALKNWLLEQPHVTGALMSGSGSTVFAVLDHAEAGVPLITSTRENFGNDLWCVQTQTIATHKV